MKKFIIVTLKIGDFHKNCKVFFAYGKGFKKRINNLKKIYLIDDIKFQNNDLIIDVGANNGDFFFML